MANPGAEGMSQTPQKDHSDTEALLKFGEGPPRAASKRKPLRDRTVTLTLSLPKAVFSALFLVFLLVWAFIFGVMLGRGHNPEEIVPELARVMPTPAPQAQTPPDEGMDNVLRPQDLKYRDSLKGKDAGSPPRVAPAPPQRAEQPARPEARQPASSEAAQKPAPQTAGAKPAPPDAAISQGAQDQTAYNYTYQVSASTNKASSENMQNKLKAAGLSARISPYESNGVTWYRILVSFRGKPDDTRTLRAKLTQQGISTIILREKVPVQ